jgi:cobaltochelatase CobT
VFKDSDQPWRRSRPDLAALFKPDMYREGLDGEAVAWAMARTAGGHFRRRIVLVVSDGGPAESATDAANEDGYLDRHLTEVVAAASRTGHEVYGLGLGRDLSAFYPRSRILAVSEAPTPASFRDVLALLRR